jgi:hypothetical protein
MLQVSFSKKVVIKHTPKYHSVKESCDQNNGKTLDSWLPLTLLPAPGETSKSFFLSVQ